ncbi:MAG: hypothetical protein HEP71_09520 [Roseivirga sp.]|nr:hypothetical protein [Roseivirga sp.]
MKNQTVLIYTLLTIIPFLSCSGDDGPVAPEQLPVPGGIQILDYGNRGDGRDLFISFLRVPEEDKVKSYHLILVKEGSTAPDIETAPSLNADKMFTITKTGFAIEEQVSRQFSDLDGDPVRNDQPYTAYLYTESNTDAFQGSLSSGTQVTLKDTDYYEVRTLITLPGLEAISYSPEGFLMMPGSRTSLYRVDLSTSTYRVFDSNLNWPLGGGYDINDGVYYASLYGGGQILKYTHDGESTVIATGLQGPTGIVSDGNGNLFVANYDGGYISKIDSDGQKTIFANNSSGLINGPDGLVLVGNQLYSINFLDGRILKISSTGEVSLFTTLPGTTTGYIGYAGGYFYVPSLSERKLFKIDMNGNFESIAGLGADGFIDGPAPLARFSTPNGVAIKGDTVFVGDNGRIRMVIRHD